MGYVAAEEYIRKINAETYGGYSDWRLPTLEEAMSLMEPEQKNGLFIAGQFDFDKEQHLIWTSDKFTTSWAWCVSFTNGLCYYSPIISPSASCAPYVEGNLII